MEFHLDSRERIVNHWMLQCPPEILEKLRQTPDYVNRQKFVAKVTINGVSVPFESLDSYFAEVYQSMAKDVQAKYQNMDVEKEVQRRLEERMKAEAQPIIDKLWKLNIDLEEIGSAIKPYWEK